MNQEEFDNKLNEAFKNEYLPPNEKLWQNISGRLDHKKKTPFWYWLMPLVLVLITATALFINLNKSEKNSKIFAINNTQNIENNTVETNEVSKNILKNNTNETENINKLNNHNVIKTNNKFPAIALTYSENEDSKIVTQTKISKRKNTPFKLNNKNRNKGSDVDFTNQSINKNKNINTEIVENPLNIYPYKKLPHSLFASQSLELIAYEPFLITKIKNKTTPQNGVNNNRTANFDSKWWWSAGIGPQLAVNNMKIKDTFQPYIHKYLWENKNAVTNNGTGIQSQFLVGYKINKHISIESGLQYSLRTESIRLNAESDSIAFRSSNGTIGAYRKVLLLAILVDPITGQKDTTPYNAIQAFTLIANNKYHTITIPFKINTEFNIIQDTKFQFGLGVGLTYMYAKKTAHYDMLKEEIYTANKKSMLTASFNTQLAFYTNFNNMGEIGVYTGFQGYLNRWNAVNKQYSIGMSDLQLGLCFRRPF